MDFWKSILKDNLDKLYLAVMFVTGAAILILWGTLPHVADWVEKGVVIGAILMLITGNKKTAPSPDGPTVGKVVTTIHTEEETKPTEEKQNVVL